MTMKTAMLAIAAMTLGTAAFGGVRLVCDYPGGSIVVKEIDERNGVVNVAPNLADTKGRKWMRFDFKVRGAEGRTLHFQFPADKFDYLATLGPAVSRDEGRTWAWLHQDGSRHEPSNAFDWTFAPDEHETRFAFCIPYLQSDWEKLAAKYKGRKDVVFGTLCKSQSGERDTELLRLPCIGSAKWLFVFTARHHASEASASFVMEGAIEESLSGSKEAAWLRHNADCVFIPFMDKDGVENGEQGKFRHPHDHNRDYMKDRYTSVRAFKELLAREGEGKKIFFLDLHAPSPRSGATGNKIHDHAFTFAPHDPAQRERWKRFRRAWADLQKNAMLKYSGKFDKVSPAKEYETAVKKRSLNARQYVGALPNCWMSVCCEFGYSLCDGVFSPEGGRELGCGLLKAVAATLRASASSVPVVVVVPDEATAVEKFAASELAGELGTCLGAVPEIHGESELSTLNSQLSTLYVGATKAAKAVRGGKPYETDEVFLKSIADGVVLDGDPQRAPVYAVDLYLEKFCGVRWWTSDAATYPKLSAAPVEGIDLSYAPQFKYRETYYLDGFDPLFKVRSKGNFTSQTRYMLSELKFIPPEMGGNHRLYFFEGRRSAYHSFFEILPPDVYFGKHPDWYSLVNGKREAKQLCLANEEMKAEYIKETLRRLREDSSVDFIQVSQNDWKGCCECEKCKAMMDEDGGVPSGPYLRFANDVAEAVEKEFPDVRIDTFAYLFTRKAPTKTRPRHNVVVRLCDIECDFARPLTDPLPPHEAKFVQDLADWRRVAGGNLFLWDYLANFKGYMLPHPNIGVIAPNIRLFAANGAVGVFEQGDALCSAGSFATLRHYVVSHLLWNPADDEKRLVDEFLVGYYGSAAAPILKKFIALVDNAPEKTKSVVKCGHKGVPFMTAGDKLEAARLMDEAVAAAERDGEAYAARVRRERLSVDHYMILNYDALKKAAAEKGYAWTRPETRAEALENWIRDVKALGVKARKETTRAEEIDEYFDSLRKETELKH